MLGDDTDAIDDWDGPVILRAIPDDDSNSKNHVAVSSLKMRWILDPVSLKARKLKVRYGFPDSGAENGGS